MGLSSGGQEVWDQVVEDRRYGIKYWRTEGMGSSSGGQEVQDQVVEDRRHGIK